MAPNGDSWWRFYLLTGIRLDAPAPFVKVLGKGRKVRHTPLEGETRAIARRLVLRAVGGRVWPCLRRQMSRRWKRERERLGWASDVTLHVFRRDFISRLANDGHTPLPVLQRPVGHSNLAAP